MTEITFRLEACHGTGGYVARWDTPGGGGITTQGDSFGELQAMVAEAVGVYFGLSAKSRSDDAMVAVGFSPR